MLPLASHFTKRFTGDDTQEARLYPVLRYIQHPNYFNDTNDIGLVQTVMPIVWSRAVGPVCLPFYYPNADFSGVDVTATGWGSTEFGGPKSDYLQKVDLTVLKNDDPKCKTTYENIQESQMCTYAEDKDTCQVSSIQNCVWEDQSDVTSFCIFLICFLNTFLSKMPYVSEE